MSRLILDQSKVQFIVVGPDMQIVTPNAYVAYLESGGGIKQVMKRRGSATEPMTWQELFARAMVDMRKMQADREAEREYRAKLTTGQLMDHLSS